MRGDELPGARPGDLLHHRVERRDEAAELAARQLSGAVAKKEHAQIVSVLQSIESLPEFYAIGGTRSRILDALLVLALLGGIGIPAGHTAMKWLFRNLLTPVWAQSVVCDTHLITPRKETKPKS